MAKFYVKNENDVWVKATEEQLADPNIEKLQVDDPPEKSSDSITELKDLVKTLAGDVKEKTEKIENDLAAFNEWKKKGLPIPGATADMNSDERSEIFGRYDSAMQGKRLADRFYHPALNLSEEKRMEFAKWWCLVLRAGVFGEYKAAEKFRQIYKASSTPLGDGSDTTQSFPLPDILEAEILALAREKSVILQYASIVDMTSNKQSWPIETGSAAVTWANETADSNPTISEVELDALEMGAISTVKNTLLADTRSDIVSWLTENLAESAGQDLDDKAFNGTGTPCSGMLTAYCGYSVQMASTKDTLAEISADVLSEMIAKLDGQKKAGARFFMNGVVLHYIRTLKDDQSRPIFADQVALTPVPTIYGFPYTECIKITGTDAAPTAFVVFGNLKYFFVGRRLGSTSLAVNPWRYWTTHRTSFMLYQRWAMELTKPQTYGAVVRLLTAAS